MSDPDFTSQDALLATQRVAILGMGLMGGSLAMALRGHCAALLGVDPDANTRALARRLGIVDQISPDPAEILPDADVVILAAPVGAILNLIPKLPDLHPGRAVVMDLGSTKTEILRALDALPERFDPLGGHPICGKETAGLVHAEAALYHQAPFAFVPLNRTTDRARRLAEELASIAGSLPIWVDGETHDRWTAATSHLPYLVAVSLSLATPLGAAAMVGPGFRSASRLAASSPAMMLDIIRTNRQSIMDALGRFRKELDRVQDHLTCEEYSDLDAQFNKAVTQQLSLTANSR